MLQRFQYKDETERKQLIEKNRQLILVEEQNLFEGNFLVFSDNPIPNQTVYTQVPLEEFEGLKRDNNLLRAQNKSITERADFHEEVLSEIILAIS